MRIVAASVLAAEVMLAIAPRERIAAVHTLVGDARYSMVVDEAKGLPLVGAEPEQLLSVRPDLVITDAFTKPETQALLEAAGVLVVRTVTPTSFADVVHNIRTIGSVCHLETGAEALVDAMERRLGELRPVGSALAACRVMSLDGAYHTYGNGSLFDAVVRASGARNLAAQNGAGPFRKLDIEAVLAWRPEVLVIDAISGSVAEERAWIDQSPGFSLLPCVENDRIVFVPSALFGTTSHHLVDTVAFLQDALHKWGPW